ncbi:MAG: hypothetical protein PWP28_2716 [Oceanotoga sp.]|jgi:hypothetical protein|nr:hypothetical protein [Oceanotoga sp.]
MENFEELKKRKKHSKLQAMDSTKKCLVKLNSKNFSSMAEL